jgi:hypothetical protein
VRGRVLERGVVIDKARGYVYVRFKRQGRVNKELMGRITEPDSLIARTSGLKRCDFAGGRMRTVLNFGRRGS